jgi:hypothetical protein
MTASRTDSPGLRSGQRLASAACSVNVIVTDPGTADEVPHCGSEQMQPGPFIRCSEPDWPGAGSARTLAGVVYWDATTGLKLACTRSGSGVLSLSGREMVALNSALRSPLDDGMARSG